MADGPVIQRSSERALEARRERCATCSPWSPSSASADDDDAGGADGLRESDRAHGTRRVRREGCAGRGRGRRARSSTTRPRRAADWLAALEGSGIDPIFLLSPTSSDARIELRGARGERLHLLRVAEGRDGRGEHRHRATSRRCSRASARTPRCPWAWASASATAPRRSASRAWPTRWSIGSRIVQELAPIRRRTRRERARASLREFRSAMDKQGGTHELVPQAHAAQDQARGHRSRRRRFPKGCGASALRARRCSTSPTSRTTSTSARSAVSTTACRRASASISSSIPRPRRARLRSGPAGSAQVQGQPGSTSSASTEAEKETGETDALVVMQGSVKTVPLIAAAFEFGFLGGSMGSVVGERFVRGVQASLRRGTALRVLHRHGRRAHAGRAALAHADGQDHGGAAPALRCAASPSSRSSPIPPWAACRRASPSSATW